MSSRTPSNAAGSKSSSKPFASISFGYGSQALMAPKEVKQDWWTDARIHDTVTKHYIVSKLRGEDRWQLREPVSFDGLTDDTYLDWILKKARRLFLILETIGISGQIFQVLNASWVDDDLPLSREDVQGLKLSEKNDEKLNSRFFTFQHSFLLRETRRGTLIQYDDSEIVPIEFVQKSPPTLHPQSWDRCRPVSEGKTFVRRRISLGNGSYQTSVEEFVENVQRAKDIEHPHLAKVWAAYTWRGSGYTLSSFLGENTLKSFMEQKQPSSLQKFSKIERVVQLQQWINCLAETLRTLHERGIAHTEIRPSNIIVDSDSRIAFSDIGSLSIFQKDKKRDETEVYNYSPPEHFSSVTALAYPYKANSRESKVSTTSSSGSSSHSTRSSSSTDFIRSLQQRAMAPPSPPLSDIGDSSPVDTQLDGRNVQLLHSPEKGDIFSLGCIFLDILTFLMEGKLSSFIKQRSSKRKTSLSLASSSITSAPSAKASSSKMDASFHANLNKLDSWIKHLSDESCDCDDSVYRGVPRLAKVVRTMLSINPQLRPSAQQVCERVSDALRSHSGIAALHCMSLSFNETATNEQKALDTKAVPAEQFSNLNATNMFRLRNASKAGVALEQREGTALPLSLQGNRTAAIPPSPPDSEPAVSPIYPDENDAPVPGQKVFTFPPTSYYASSSSTPSAGSISPTHSVRRSNSIAMRESVISTSPPRSIPRSEPRIVPQSHSALNAAISVDGAQRAFQHVDTSVLVPIHADVVYPPRIDSSSPAARCISTTSSASLDALGIISEYSGVDYSAGSIAAPLTGPSPTPLPDKHAHIREIPVPQSFSAKLPASGLFDTSPPLQRTRSATAAPTISSKFLSPRPAPAPPGVLSRGNSSAVPIQRRPSLSNSNHLSAELVNPPTSVLSPTPISSFSPALSRLNAPIFSYDPADRPQSRREPSPAPAGPPPPIPLSSKPNLALTASLPSPRGPAPTSALPPVPTMKRTPSNPPPLPQMPHLNRAFSPPPPLPHSNSAPGPFETLPDAPAIPCKSPRRRYSHARSRSDLLMDDAMSAWKDAAQTPEKRQADFVNMQEFVNMAGPYADEKGSFMDLDEVRPSRKEDEHRRGRNLGMMQYALAQMHL
ncbi:MAG: hypothetical protein M1820_003570 [Bogoriella megaspora]|nr:MAG: hypothetical protein M1820_003570 [Bogoriella megaspora]